jgi:hypothetical protein
LSRSRTAPLFNIPSPHHGCIRDRIKTSIRVYALVSCHWTKHNTYAFAIARDLRFAPYTLLHRSGCPTIFRTIHFHQRCLPKLSKHPPGLCLKGTTRCSSQSTLHRVRKPPAHRVTKARDGQAAYDISQWKSSSNAVAWVRRSLMSAQCTSIRSMQPHPAIWASSTMRTYAFLYRKT